MPWILRDLLEGAREIARGLDEEGRLVIHYLLSTRQILEVVF